MIFFPFYIEAFMAVGRHFKKSASKTGYGRYFGLSLPTTFIVQDVNITEGDGYGLGQGCQEDSGADSHSDDHHEVIGHNC